MSVRSTTLRASAGVALVALMLAPPPGAEAAVCRGLADDDAVICEINRIRDHRGLAAFTVERRLERAAVVHARDMAARRYFSHVTPEGRRFTDRLRVSGYITGRTAWRVGETLAWGRGALSGPAATVAGWMRSASHRRILLGPYAEIGVGVARGTPLGGRGMTYAADFGRLR